MMKLSGLIAAIGTSVVVAGAAQAIPMKVTPISYDMPNGYSGTYNYWDDLYTGAGNNMADGAALSGGVGDLTDGYIETLNWINVEGPRGPNGPYVGWLGIDPMISFKFAKAMDFLSVTFHIDDSNNTGGVRPPSRIDAAGRSQPVIDPPTANPFAVTIDLTGITTDTIDTQLFRQGGSWIFLSEVEFYVDSAPQVPLPAPILLLGTAMAGLGVAHRRRRRH